MDPSACRLHPGVAVTGFCPACLRDRLAGLHPPSSAADLRRCKSFSYARSAAAVEPQRRSCDLSRRQEPPIAIAEPEEEAEAGVGRNIHPSRKSLLGALLGNKLQQWRRKNKKAERVPPPEVPSCDPRGFSGLAPAAMLSVEEEEDMPVPRSDGQIPVEEDYWYYGGVPGGSAQTRDYYLDSSSSSRRRRSLDYRSGRSSFSGDASSCEVARMMNANARVSPAIAAECVLVTHGHYHSRGREQQEEASEPKKQGIKGWSIWGFIHKKNSSKSEADHHRRRHHGPPFSSAEGAGNQWPPELRARGYDGQMLRCNSSISARSSFSGGAAMTGGRRSISGRLDMGRNVNDGHGLLERNLLSTSSRSSRSSRPPPHLLELDHPIPMGHQIQFPVSGDKHQQGRSRSSKPPPIPRH